MTVLFHLGLFILLTTVGVIVRGAIIANVWEWYLVPLGVKSVNWAAAMGVSSLISLFTLHATSSNDKEEYKPIKSFVVGIVLNLLIYLIAWIIKGYAAYGR